MTSDCTSVFAEGSVRVKTSHTGDISHIWPWVILKGQIQGHSDIESLYLVKELGHMLLWNKTAENCHLSHQLQVSSRVPGPWTSCFGYLWQSFLLRVCVCVCGGGGYIIPLKHVRGLCGHAHPASSRGLAGITHNMLWGWYKGRPGSYRLSTVLNIVSEYDWVCKV